ncbi:hypothetical protein T492DRAFT_844180 [Pavlovales sp. CCMP2436]|nr:hypothetical protein T492DRAFT_844180 [Pavlovales sp. CCMP2436]
MSQNGSSCAQEEKAAQLKEREADYQTAIQLYIKGGLPAKAARLALQLAEEGEVPQQTLETIAAALSRASMHEKAGMFYERLGEHQQALDSYKRGSIFSAAVELSRRVFQGRGVVELEGRGVVELEVAWGDHLVSTKQTDAAVNHYVEAGSYSKAVDAAVSSRQWAKAAQIVQHLDSAHAMPYYGKIAKHYETTGALDEAEAYFVRGGSPAEAVEMRLRASQWERAQQVASAHMSATEVAMLYMKAAHKLEGSGKLREAERLYLQVHEPGLAIDMYKKANNATLSPDCLCLYIFFFRYKKARKYDDMIRLVASFRKELLQETYLHLAQQLETEGAYKQTYSANRHGFDARGKARMRINHIILR